MHRQKNNNLFIPLMFLMTFLASENQNQHFSYPKKILSSLSPLEPKRSRHDKDPRSPKDRRLSYLTGRDIDLLAVITTSILHELHLAVLLFDVHLVRKILNERSNI